MYFRFFKVSLAATGFVAALISTSAVADLTVNQPIVLSKDTVWSGKVSVIQAVKVPKKVTLRVMPGAVVRFGDKAGLTVEGILKAEGNKSAPVTFTSKDKSPVAGCWPGISFSESKKVSVLKRCVISYAASVSIASCSPEIKNCTITQGGQGIVIARKAKPVISGNTIRDIAGSGINCQLGAFPSITGNTIEKCGKNGIVSSQNAEPLIKNNTITGCDTGISVQAAQIIEGNVIKDNKCGLFASIVGTVFTIEGNRFIDNITGAVCQQYTSPIFEKNELTGNKEGLVCFRASSPTVKYNDFYKNKKAILCIQISHPTITANDIHDNDKGIYLHLSSYALINGNNIWNNKIQVELGNMSSDWERRVKHKPTRGRQAQNINMASRAKAVPQKLNDGAKIMGSVDASGNWWGADVTREMDGKGPQANIKSFIDGYDRPTRTYKGYSGVYLEDRIDYSGWKETKIKNAGIN